jgi:hypothetical protein
MITQTFIENNPVMNDPRSYSTHEDFELGYEDDKPTEKYPLDDWEDEEEGQVVSGRSWLPINTDSRPVAKQGGGQNGGNRIKGSFDEWGRSEWSHCKQGVRR